MRTGEPLDCPLFGVHQIDTEASKNIPRQPERKSECPKRNHFTTKRENHLPTTVNQWNRSTQQRNRSLNLPRTSSYSKEYNDSQRIREHNRSTFTNEGNRRNTSQLNSSDRSTSEFEQPLHESTRANSPDSTRGNKRIMEMQCA